MGSPFRLRVPVKVSNERFAEAFRERLEKKARFKFVAKPMPTKTNNKYRAKQGL
jgi:hypothetical protein